MRYKGRPIADWYAQLPPGKLSNRPQLFWAQACRWWGERWADWCELEASEQEFRLAVYRQQQMIDAVLAWEHARAQQKAARRRGR